MTILALYVEPDRVTAWTDTEVSCDAGKTGHRNKMVVNGLAGLVCLGTGSVALGDAADAAVMHVRDLDHAVRVLPDRLRQEAVKLVRRQGFDPRRMGEQVICLAGWSPQAGRMLAYVLDGAAMFEAVLTGSVCLPDVPEFARLQEAVPHHLVRIAKAQMHELRKGCPMATGGTLVAAILTPGSVATATLYDLAGDRWLLPGLEGEPIPAGVLAPVPEHLAARQAAPA